MTKPHNQKLIIYQIFPRIFTNRCAAPKPDGSYEENGSGKFNDYDDVLLDSLADLGVNCLWMTGVIEHATKTRFAGIPHQNPNVVKGEAGSPYAICDYYDVDPALSESETERMREFEDFVKRVHGKNLKVIIDFVPNHTARQYKSDCAPDGVTDFGSSDDITKFFSPGNNYYYIPNQQFSPDFPINVSGESYVEFPAKATGNDCFNAFCSRFDWYETVKLNYGHDYWDHSDHFEPIPDTWLKMRDILLYWCSKGVDGFRCDMVFMVPLPFWHWVIPEVKHKFPSTIFIGEIYDVGLYRPFLDYGRFDYLYDKVNLYDTLVGIERFNHSAAQLTGCWQTVDGIGDRMLNFLENHDEVRFGSKAFAGNPALAVPHMAVLSFMSCGPLMIYYGQELGESATDNEGYAGDNDRSTIFDYWSYDTMRRWYNNGRCDGADLTVQEKWLRAFYSKVFHLCNGHEAIYQGQFFDLMYVNLRNPDFNPHRQFAFLRYTSQELLLIVVNFDRKSADISINVPELAFDMAEIPEGNLETKELLWGNKIMVDIQRGSPLRLKIGASDAVVISLREP